jgi:hypothetical protein
MGLSGLLGLPGKEVMPRGGDFVNLYLRCAHMPYKKAPTAVVLLSLALLAGCAGSPKHPTWKNATGSEQYERLMWQAMKSQQWKDVASHLAPMFVGVGADGRKYDREGWMAYWKSARLGDYSLGEVMVDPAGTNMVVSYVLVISQQPAAHTTNKADPTGGNNGIGTSGVADNTVASNQPLRVLSVWQQVKSGWIMTASSFTPVRE